MSTLVTTAAGQTVSLPILQCRLPYTVAISGSLSAKCWARAMTDTHGILYGPADCAAYRRYHVCGESDNYNVKQ